MVSLCFYNISFSTGLVSHILTNPSSDTDIKCVYLPSLGDLLSTFIVGGTNTISATKFLCEAEIPD